MEARWTVPAIQLIVGRAASCWTLGSGVDGDAGQRSRLDAKLDALAAAIDTDSRPITIVVFAGETREFALQRHRELRPDHAGRSVRFKHHNEPRTEVAEMFAVHAPEELQAVIDRIEANGRRKPIGEQMLSVRTDEVMSAPPTPARP